MSNAAATIDAIGEDSARLDMLEKLLETATTALDLAEEAWLEVYDKTAEALKDEMESEGRKGDPAQHWIETQARKANRVAWSDWRRARRATDMLEKRVKAKTAALSGRQTQINALRDELNAERHASARALAGQTYGGGRRA